MSNVSSVYDELAEGISSIQVCSTVKPYIIQNITGYVHPIINGNAILITDNFIPYLIPIEMVEEYMLDTGDKVYCEVAYSTHYDRDMVTKINDIVKSVYDKSIMVRCTRDFKVNNSTIKLGNTVLYKTNDNTDIYDTVENIFKFVPMGTQKFVLSFDGRKENFNDTYKLFNTNLTDSNRNKLTTCLLAFFEAKELAGNGKDVVLVIDSIDKMFHVYNGCMQKGNFVDPQFISYQALTDLESILRCSGSIRDKGTLTIIGLHKEVITDTQKFVSERLSQIFDGII